MGSPLSKPVQSEEVDLQAIHSEETQLTYWKSNLFNEVYLRQDVPTKYTDRWESDDDEDFQYFMNTLRNIASAYGNKMKTLKKWSETQTINSIIKPVLKGLGWCDECDNDIDTPFLEETSFRYKNKTYRTDILVVDLPDDKDLVDNAKGESRLAAARKSVLMPVEAKYWERLELDRQNQRNDLKRSKKSKSDDVIANMSDYNDQIIQYMEILKKDWGVLTDGAYWRLLNRNVSSEDSSRYFEFNLAALINSIRTESNEHERQVVISTAKYFYHLFSKKSHFPEDNTEPFVDSLLSYSKKYIDQVEEDLKDRFVKAMNYCCNGFARSAKEIEVDISIHDIRTISESALFNVLFIKALESRSVLPMTAPDYRKLSLTNIIEKLDRYEPKASQASNLKRLKRVFSKGNGNSFEYKPEGNQLHDRIVRLNMIIHDGRSEKDDFGFEIAGFKESVFGKEQWSVFRKCKLTNEEWVKILFQVGFASSAIKGLDYQQIPYNYFTPRQLGSIYESFLEFRIEKAPFDMVYEKRQWREADLTSNKYAETELPTAKKGQLFFTPDNSERKASGSYYTPDYVTKFIVEETVGPTIASKSSKQILNMKVCDPAMGSGHFLVGALDFIAQSYMSALKRESKGDVKLTLAEAKRRVLDSCIFGIDINSRAVKLAKMSLWLKSAHINYKLERLDDQLVTANALTEQTPWSDYKSLSQHSFDAVIGNPPYIGEKGNKHQFEPVKNGFLGDAYLGKMDYFYFFFHLAFRLAKSEGKIGFITTNYFLTSTGGRLLREAMMTEISDVKIIDLRDLKVFKDAKGQHNAITLITTGDDAVNLEAISASDKGDCNPRIFEKLVSQEFKKGRFDGEQHYIRVDGSDTSEALEPLLDRLAGNPKLGKLCDVKTGIMGGCDYISKSTYKYVEQFKLESEIELGESVFVLDSKKDKDLFKRLKDSVYVKPFYKNSDIFKFGSSSKTSLRVIYSSKKSQAINDPKVEEHLSRFRPILEQIRKVNKESLDAWSFLRRGTSNQKIFEVPKIIAPQRSPMNNFGYNELSWYASADVYYIVSKEEEAIPLKYVLGLLNSKLYYAWLFYRGKRKGTTLELYQKPLSEVPILKTNNKNQEEIIGIVETLIAQPTNKAWFDSLNHKVYDVFGVSNEEIDLIEELYERNVNSDGFTNSDSEQKSA